jgi:hypothetical protein
MNTRLLAAAVAAAALAVSGAACSTLSASEGVTASHTNYLTFSRPVSLPGVTLAAGSYIFELADPTMSGEIVRVLSRSRSEVYFAGFTERVDRPWNMPRDQVVALGEAARGTPPPVTVWYPRFEASGFKFRY